MRSWGRAWAFSVLIVLALVVVSIVPEVRAAPGVSSVQVFYEDFENGWPSSWTASDDLPASGTDTWGVSDYRAYHNDGSAWCAQVGTNGSGAPNAAAHRYDRSMSADLLIPLGDLSGYSSLTLRFDYWADLGSGDIITLYDWHDGEGTPLWSETPESKVWSHVEVSVPTTCTELNFLFYSDPYLDAGGNEGVYLDDIELVGADATVPTSSVNALSAFTNTGVFDVTVSAEDPHSSGVAYVELYYAYDQATSFDKYVTTANPTGRWSPGPIAFDISQADGDGTYEFYSVATDRAGNAEEGPFNAEASTFVDSTPPVTVATITGTKGTGGWYVSNVVVTLTPQPDATSVYTELHLEGQQWGEYASPFELVAEGDNIVFFRGVDAAGNHEEEKSLDVLIDRIAPRIDMGIINGTTFTTASPFISWTVSDATSGLSKLEVRLDHDDYEEVPTSQRMIETNNLTQGSHVLWIKAYDRAGNVREGSISFVVDASTGGSGLFGGLSLDANSLIVPLVIVILVVVALVVVTLFRSGMIWKGGKKEKKKPADDGDDEVELPPPENMNKTIFVPATINMKATKICPHCDHMFLATMRECPYCGKAQPAKPWRDRAMDGLREALAISRAPRSPGSGKDESEEIPASMLQSDTSQPSEPNKEGSQAEEPSSETLQPAEPSGAGPSEEPRETAPSSGPSQPSESKSDDAREVAYRLIRLRRRTPKAP